MSIIRRDSYAPDPIYPTVEWNRSEGYYQQYVVKDGKGQVVPVTEPFYLDIWKTRHGCEVWTDKRKSYVCMVTAPASDDEMKQWPRNGKEVYLVPAYSAELGGRRDLVVKYKGQTEALDDFYNTLEDVLDNTKIPQVHVDATKTETDLAPAFEVVKVSDRPVEKFGKPDISFG